MKAHAVWIILAVLAVHAGAFWWLADKHFLPNVRRAPVPLPAHFAARERKAVDPATGRISTVSDYVVSTKLQTPAASPAR